MRRRSGQLVRVSRELKLGSGGLRDVEFAVRLRSWFMPRRVVTSWRLMDALAAMSESGYQA